MLACCRDGVKARKRGAGRLTCEKNPQKEEEDDEEHERGLAQPRAKGGGERACVRAADERTVK